MLYAKRLSAAQTVIHDKQFYFLVSESEHTQAVSSFAQLQGGAGYLLSNGDKDYVAYSVYFQKNEGEFAQKSLRAMGNVKLVSLGVNELTFKGEKEKKKAKVYLQAFSCLDGCIQVLNQEIARLDRGATQQSSKRVLQTLIRQFTQLKKEYAQTFSNFSAVCERANSQLQTCVADVIYCKDLRYILCELSQSYVQLSKEFTL